MEKIEMTDYNRKSLLTHLAKGDYRSAEEKIEDNLSSISININDLERYYKKLLYKKDKKEFITRGNSIIETNGKIFEETLIMIKDFKGHKFIKYNDRFKYLTIIQKFEERLTNSKIKFTQISEKINLENTNQINVERQSILQSRRGTDVSKIDDLESGHIFDKNNNDNPLDQKLIMYQYNDELDSTMIKERGEQIELIMKIMEDINKLSKECATVAFKSGKTVDQISDHIVDAHGNTKKALEEIKEANKLNEERHSSTGFFSVNKVLVVLLVFVGVLFTIAVSSKKN